METLRYHHAKFHADCLLCWRKYLTGQWYGIVEFNVPLVTL